MIRNDNKLPAARRATNVLREPPRQWFVDYLPVTGGNNVDLLVNGKNYGESLYAALMGAKSEVLLTGLHFQPDWRLLRTTPGPIAWDDPSTLLRVLQKLAAKGVKIYLLVNQFWANEWTTSNPIRKAIKKAGNLQWYLPETSRLFRGLSNYKNVQCRTDVHQGIIMSTHHQKTVIIDKKVAFVGGIDLTLVDGDRWDEASHIVPPTPPAPEGEYDEDANDFSGYDHEDDGEDDDDDEDDGEPLKIVGGAEPRQIFYGPGDKRLYSLPEHFWHDVHCKFTGPAVEFVLDNFHARWNHGVLYKNVWWREEIKNRYSRIGRRRRRTPYRFRYIGGEFEDEDARHTFERITVPPQIYQDRMRNQKSIHVRPDDDEETGAPEVVKASGLDSVPSLSGTKVQVIRSMPVGQYTGDAQRPPWNISGELWERSAKDAYIIGIRAARDYIYLENQWISDEHIWAELKASMRRNRDNPKFRIVIVIPRKPLAAAGYGTDQDVNLKPHVDDVIAESRAAEQFGMYCLEAPVPQPRREDVGLAEADKKAAKNGSGLANAQIYVHSKVLIVDDTWGLIGSANAGGISLMGMSNFAKVFTTGRGSAPDTELSVIIHDPGFGKDFREALWKEHLQMDGIPGGVDAAADLFREKAALAEHRVRPAVLFQGAIEKGREGVRRVPRHIVQAVQANSVIMSSAPGPLSLADGALNTFSISLFHPGSVYEVKFRWRIKDDKGNSWLLRGLGSEKLSKKYGDATTAFLPDKVTANLGERIGTGEGNFVVTCRAVILPKGVTPNGSADETRKRTVLIELPITVTAS